ncbi:hypothetical protein [Alistipes sp. ZOR0009]|uniref:hypothetical protein n=1 Tax=Alistipes sp. ZOR0009 TaxID=1339253 RepID=UPI000B0E3B1C|nr:hypothetical protein [Alistipes sp. ZOR0009]
MTLGLADGKMGICIYFYVLSRYEQDKEYKIIGDNILDDIFQKIDNISSIDIKTGLSGIGLGINYLIKNKYVEGNVNNIIKSIDDTVYKTISDQCNLKLMDSTSLIHAIHYLCTRLKEKKLTKENEFIFKEITISTLNYMYERLDLTSYEESLPYTTDYFLPQLFYVFSEIYDINFYNYRLIKIIEEISNKILSIIPILHCNKLLLLWGMNSLQRRINNNKFEKHITLIKNQIDINEILDNELKAKNIFFNNGYASIYPLLYLVKDKIAKSEMDIYKNCIYTKLSSPDILEFHINKSKDHNSNRFFYSGLCGTILMSYFIKKTI